MIVKEIKDSRIRVACLGHGSKGSSMAGSSFHYDNQNIKELDMLNEGINEVERCFQLLSA